MNLKTIINILPFVGLLVMVLWGFLGNAWNISWIAVLKPFCVFLKRV